MENQRSTRKIDTNEIQKAREEADEFEKNEENSTEERPTSKPTKERLNSDEIEEKQQEDNKNIKALRNKIKSGEVMLSPEGEARKQMKEIKNNFEGSFENEEINNEIIKAYIDDETAQKYG